jgi:DNA-binding NarL/FixJ family response regulator
MSDSLNTNAAHARGVLTDTEVELVEELIKDGANRKQIAERTFRSEHAIRWHYSNMFEFTGVRTQTALALWWIRKGRYKQAGYAVDDENSTDRFVTDWSR